MHTFMFHFVVILCMCDVVFSAACLPGHNICDWEDWGAWSSCSKTCGDGTRTRFRELCCKENDDFLECYKSCNLHDEYYRSEECGFVCPAGNCTFERIVDTDIKATDYTQLAGTGGGYINTPIHILDDLETCRRYCVDANNQNGLFCWAYTFSEKNMCNVYFFKSPLTLTKHDMKGKTNGSSLYIRRCTAAVQCEATSADIVFLVDSSGSIGTENFESVKTFISGIISGLDIDPDLTRVGLLLFNEVVTWQFKLGELHDKLSVLKAIQGLKYVIGGTMTAAALESVRNEGFKVNRTGVPMIAVIITDGLSRFPSLTRIQASLLRMQGVTIYAIGVGNNSNIDEIYNMASIPEDKYMHMFSSFESLDPRNISLSVNKVKCKEQVRTTTEATVTTEQNNCTDKIDNCEGYGKDMCTDYAPWAHEHCSLTCHFCEGAKTTAAACFDVLPNCASYGAYICQDRAYVQWVAVNCRQFCEICKSAVTTPITTTITTTTTPVCEDTINSCDDYIHSCHDENYHGFLAARCSATCGYCQSHKTINGTVIHGEKCPDWHIPVECTMVTTLADCCPLPSCPSDYVFTAEIGKV